MSLLDPDNLPHTIDVAPREYGTDASGGSISLAPTYTTKLEPAWVQTASADDVEEFAAKNLAVTHKVYVTRNLGVNVDDFVLVHGGPYDGVRLTVKANSEASVGLNMLWRIMAEIDRQADG
jgi:hypothetical protein